MSSGKQKLLPLSLHIFSKKEKKKTQTFFFFLLLNSQECQCISCKKTTRLLLLLLLLILLLLLPYRKPNRRLLEMQRLRLVIKPSKTSRLFNRLRTRHTRRQKRQDLRRYRLLRQQPNKPNTRNTPLRRNPRRATLDRLLFKHAHQIKTRTHYQQLQNLRRTWISRTHHRKRLLNSTIRSTHHHPQSPHLRL